MIQTDQEALTDGDFVHLRFLKDKFYIGITTVFNADFSEKEFDSEELSNKEFFKNKYLYDDDLIHDDTFNVMCYPEGTDELEEKFHVNCILIIESAYKNIDGKVRFESQIRLKHRFTGMYLTFQPQNIDSGEKFTFQKQATDDTIFIVHSVTKAKLESDPLEQQNVVSLQLYGQANDKFIGFNFQTEKLRILSNSEAIVISKFSPNRLGKYAHNIFSGDIIRLLHIDTEGFLEANIQQNYLKLLAKQFNAKESEKKKIEDFFSFQTIEKKYRFQIEKSSFNQTQQKTYGCNNIFLICKEDKFDGSLITRKDNFRLKHLASDTYFNLQNYEVESEEQLDDVNEFNSRQQQRSNKLNQLKSKNLEAAYGNQPIKLEEIMTFELKSEKVKYNYPVMIQSIDYYRVLKVKDILDRKQIQQLKYLSLQVGPLEQGLNILENWNPLRVANNTISDFIFVKDFRDMITQVIEYKVTKNEEERYIQLLKFTMIACQRMVNFLSQFTNEDEGEKEETIRKIMQTDLPHYLNLRKFKYFQDMHLTEYMLTLNYILWKKLNKRWDILVLGMKQMELDQNKQDAQAQQQKQEIEKIIKHDDDISENRINLILAILKLYEVSNEIVNLSLQSPNTLKIVKDLQLIDSFVDQVQLSSNLVTSNYATLLKLHFKKCQNLISEQHIKKLVKLIEMKNPYVNKLVYREKVIDIFILIAFPQNERPVKTLQLSITKRLFGHLKTKNKDKIEDLKKKDTNTMFRFYHDIDNLDNTYPQVYIKFHEDDTTFGQDEQEHDTWKLQQPLINFLTDKEIEPEIQLYKKILYLLRSLSEGGAKEMQVAISQIFPMEVIITILTQAINANQKLQFPKDVMGLLMEILVEVYIKHHQLPQLYGTFNQQQKLKFNLDTLQEKSRTEGEKISKHSELEDFVLNKVAQQRRLSYQNKSKQFIGDIQSIQDTNENQDDNQNQSDDNANNDNEDEDRGSQNEGSISNSIDDDLENRSFTNDDGSQNGDNYSQTDSYLSSNTNNTSKHSLYGLQEKPKNSTQQDAIKDIINLILNIAKYITQENFLKLVARGERKTCLLFISSMNLFKFYFLRMKKLDKEFQEIIGYDKMTEILKDFNEKYIIESNTSYKTMTNEENLYLGNALKSILDFVWIERDYKQVKYTGQIWTEVQEFAKQLILQNPYRVYKDGLRVLRVGFISNQQASKAKKSKQEKEQQKLSDVHKFLRIEEKYHTSKDILDRQFVKQIKASKQEPFQDMQLELYDQQKILKDYIIHYDEEIIDFIPLEDQQKQDALYMNFETKIQSIIHELYEQEFKFTSSLHPSKFQALILDILGQEPQFCQAAMKILQKDFFPVSNIYENIQNAQISTTKGESHLIKHLDDLKKKFRTSLYPNLLKKITKETPSQVKKTIPLFVSKPDQLLPGLLEIFHVQFSKSIKCKYCGRWYTHTDVNQEQAIMKGMMAINLNEDHMQNNLIVDHKSNDSDGEMSDLDNADQTNKKMTDIEHYNIHEVVNNCKNSLPQEYVDKIIKSRKLKKYTFGHLEEEKAEVEKEQRILNYKFNHINHNPKIPEQNIIDITKQNLMEQKGFNKIIFDFIKKTFFKIENDSVLQGLEKHDDILLLISYCYKFTYYYILNHEEHTKEIIADDKLWECMTQMMSVKDNPKYNHIVLDAYDIIIEVMKNEDNINFLKEKSLNFLDLFLKDVCAMDINACCDKNFKILQMGNYIIKGLSAEDKDHIREYIKQFQLDQVIKTSAKMFFVYDEIGNIKKFIGDDLFIQLFREEYDHIKNEQEKQYALYANYYQRHQYSKLNYYLELFEFLSSFVAFLPTEFSGLVINSTEKQNIVIQNEILNYILDFKKPVMVQIKCYLFYINVYLYSQDLNEDNSLYVFLQEPENLKNFFTNFENQKNYIEEFKIMMENCKYDDKLTPDYLLKEALIVRGIMPTISNMINERFIYLLFSQYLKLQKLHTSSYQKVLKSISLVMFNNEKYRQCLIEESKDLLSHENILVLKQQFIEQQTKGIGALSQDMVQKKLRALNAGTTPQEDLNTLQQMKNNAEKNTEKYKSLKLKILEYKTREKERSKRAVIPTFIKEFKRLVSCICELGFHLPFFTKSDNQKQIKDFYNIIFKNRFINEKLKNNSYLQDRQLGSVKKLMRYYEKLDYKGYNNNFTDISLQNVKKFLNHEIIPIALKAMKKELLHKHQKSFQTTFEEKIQYNQIITQINDPQLNEEFFFFMSPFEDLLLYLVYNSDTTVVDPNLKEKAQIEAANKKKFEEIIQKKYKAPKTSIKEIFGQDYYRIFERKENISNILTYIFHYIESTLDNLENKKMFILAKNYIRVLQSILFKYGATCQKCEYYEFKDSKMKLKEEQIKEENQMTLEHIQDYLIEYYDAPRMVCSALMESYIQLDKIQNDKTQKESNNFLPYLIQIMKFANVLISNYNESGQEEFLNVIQGHHSAFMMKNQMVIFGIQKIMRYCSERIKNGANEEVQQTTLLAESMLKFFQDLCDGNNKNAQDFLRNQPNLLKSVNLVYEISVMADYFIENIKQQFFIYVNLQEKELKIFKKLFGKQNRDYQNSLNKKHKKFWNFYKTKKHRVDIFQPLIQCFKTIIELINGPNIENIKVIINTLSPQKINLTFEFLNSYFMKFDFKVPKTGQTATYYGCFALSQEYLKTLTDNNPEEALFRSVMFGQKGSENMENDMYEEDEDEDQQQIQQNQNLNSTYNSETTLINKTKYGSNSTMARPKSNQIQPIASGIIKANKIKIQVNRGHAAFSKTIVAKRSQLREIYKTRQFLMNLEQKKIKFTQTLYELEKSMLDYLNFLFQSRNSIESANKTDNSFQEYLNNFDYSLLLDNLQQRFEQKVESSYASRVILAYYSVFLANLQNELSTEQNLIMEKFLLWENQDFGKRDHKKFIGSIEVVNESSQLQRIFFKIPKSVLRVWNLHIMQEKRNEIIDTVKRDNPEDKVKDLFDKFNNLEHMIEYQNYIYRILNSFLPKSVRDFSFYKLKNSNSLLTKLFILLNLIQNIFQISYTQSNETNFYYEDESSWVRAQFEIFAFASIIIIIYLTFTEFIDDFIFESIEVFYRKEDIRQQSIIIRYFTYVQKILKWLGRLTKFLGSQTSFWVHCTIATTQILGYSYDSSFFAYGLIMIIWGIDFTKEIINAVFSHIDQVIGSILLSIIVLYWFVIIAYNAPWNAEYGFESQMNCDSLVHCIQVHFDYGYLTPPIWNLSPLPISGTIWTFFFNLFVNIILTAIISGIIIDTFGERREQKKQIKSDTLNKCFICNIEREEFERSRKDFNHHEIEEHNKYNYLFYNIAVKKMTPSTRTNIDDWIVKNNEDNTIKHIPIQRCLMLQQYANQDSDQFSTATLSLEFSQMRDVMEGLNNKFMKFEKNIKESISDGKKNQISQK